LLRLDDVVAAVSSSAPLKVSEDAQRELVHGEVDNGCRVEIEDRFG
jgi:hypothetical protein